MYKKSGVEKIGGSGVEKVRCLIVRCGGFKMQVVVGMQLQVVESETPRIEPEAWEPPWAAAVTNIWVGRLKDYQQAISRLQN